MSEDAIVAEGLAKLANWSKILERSARNLPIGSPLRIRDIINDLLTRLESVLEEETPRQARSIIETVLKKEIERNFDQWGLYRKGATYYKRQLLYDVKATGEQLMSERGYATNGDIRARLGFDVSRKDLLRGVAEAHYNEWGWIKKRERKQVRHGPMHRAITMEVVTYSRKEG